MQFLGMLGFYLHLSHICSALRLTSTWGSDFFCSSCGWAPPAAGACWGCFFVDWWWWSRSFNHSDVLFPCNINSHHLYCSLVKEDVPALIWAVQHFEVYSHQRLEWDKAENTEWSVAWRSMAVCFLFYMKLGHILSKRADQVPRWGVFIGAPPQPHTEAGQSLVDCVCQLTMLY